MTVVVPIDSQARVALAHAAVQALAERTGVDLLHLKGPALDPTLTRPDRQSSDADVLVRAGHVDPLVQALLDDGWRLVTDFANGSAFEHAANYHHDHWGYVDVHRAFPGVTLPPEVAFERMWLRRGRAEIAHWRCPVPELLDQALLLCLHAARSQGDRRAQLDLALVWHDADAFRRDELRGRAREFGAQVAFAAAVDELGRFQHDPSADLWRFYSRGGTRMDEWLARLKAAPDRRERWRTALRSLRVNREYAAMDLGQEPSQRQLTRIFFGRIGTAVRQGGPRAARRLGRGRRGSA